MLSHYHIQDCLSGHLLTRGRTGSSGSDEALGIAGPMGLPLVQAQAITKNKDVELLTIVEKDDRLSIWLS